MAVTENTYTGDGSTVLFSFTFPYLDVDNIKVSLDGSDTTEYTLANATTVQLNSAPAVGVVVRIYRNSDTDTLESTFFPGTPIRAADLNDNFLQSLYLNQETRRIAQEASLGDIADGSIGSVKLTAEAVVESKIGPGAVTEAKISSGAVTETKIGAAAVTANKIAANAVGTTQLADDAVTNSKLSTSAVNSNELASSAVITDKIANSAVTTAKIADSAVTDAKIGDNVLTPYVSSVNNGPLAGFRNAIINGNFDVWQRGTSFIGIANGGYCADRWLVQYDGSGGSRAISQLTFPPGQTDVPYGPTYYLRLNQSVAGSGATFNYLAQRIEDVRTFAGQTVTLSFYAQASSAITLPQLDVNQFFGGGAGSSPVTTTITSNVSIGTSWAKYSYTFAVPSISGKTIGIDPTYLALRFNLPINSTFIFYLAQVQLELGPVATPFERRPLGLEETLCYRYLQRYTNSAGMGRISYAYVGVVNSEYRGQFVFPVRMRTAPTISSNGTLAVTFGTTPHTISSIASSSTSEWGASLALAASTTGGTVGLTGHFGLSLAGYLQFDAEV